MRFNGYVSLRPVRLGWLLPPDQLATISRAAQLSMCLWGGRYNPIIPYCLDDCERWRSEMSPATGLEITKGFIDFFEPDVLVEAVPGMADSLGWESDEERNTRHRVFTLDGVFGPDDYGHVQTFTGLNIIDPIQELYDLEYKYERRFQKHFTLIPQTPGDAYFDILGGRYPDDDDFSYIREAYDGVFAPVEHKASSDIALKVLSEQLLGPAWITNHKLEDPLESGHWNPTFLIFDPKDAADVIDAWNIRLVTTNVIPINVHWLTPLAPFVKEKIKSFHRPMPNNPSGLYFHSDLMFGGSISETQRTDILERYFSDLPSGAFLINHLPFLWQEKRRGRHHAKSKLVVRSQSVSFDEEVGEKGLVQIPAVNPSFYNATKSYLNSRWINTIVPKPLSQRANPATVYPTNIWSPAYPKLTFGEVLKIDQEGWSKECSFPHDTLYLELQEGRNAIIGWLEENKIEATPSEEGQIAARLIEAAETLLGCGMFADEETLELLNSMAESRTEVSRAGRKSARVTADRARHYRQIQNHFKDRSKRAFGYWNRLDHFLRASVFQAGLRIQCPVCTFYNWYAPDEFQNSLKCARCLSSFEFSQEPDDLHKLDWYYRIIGPFAAPDYARGGYAVALTLRAIATPLNGEATWSTGLNLHNLETEIDFVAWRRRSRLRPGDGDEPDIVIGEVKSFGVGAITTETIEGLKTTAKALPPAILVVSTLRKGNQLTLAEVVRLRELAMWGEHPSKVQEPINPLIVLTGAELLASFSIRQAWKAEDGREIHMSTDEEDLRVLAELTQQRYLGLNEWYVRSKEVGLPSYMERILAALRHRANPE